MAFGYSFPEPYPRHSHVSVAVEGQAYLYGGRTLNFTEERSSLSSRMYCFDQYREFWQERRPKGPAPPGLYSGACASIGHYAFFYGGDDGRVLHGSLHQLDTSTLCWSIISIADREGPMRKSGCRMISHDNQLHLFGGYGIPSGPTQPGAWFVKDTNYRDGRGWTNEIHTFCRGKWTSPEVTGTRPPPCSGFSLTKYDDHHAVQFGGTNSNDAYIIDLTGMHWSKLRCRACFMWRYHHDAVCLGYCGDHPHLLVTGGQNTHYDALSDVWMLDLQSGRWLEVKDLEPCLQARLCHTATATSLNPKVTEVTLFGGVTGYKKDFKLIANTTVLRFEYRSSGRVKWILTDVADKSKLGTEERVREKEVIMKQLCGPKPKLKYLRRFVWKEQGKTHSFNLMEKISMKWRDIGYQIDLTKSTINSFATKHENDPERCWEEVMSAWCEEEQGADEYPVTWNGLYQLLKDVEAPEVAEQLKEAVTKFTLNGYCN